MHVDTRSTDDPGEHGYGAAEKDSENLIGTDDQATAPGDEVPAEAKPSRRERLLQAGTVVILAGEAVQDEHVQLLVNMLDGHPVARKLREALAHEYSTVALSLDDQEELLARLQIAPSALAPLRTALIQQRKGDPRTPLA